MFVDRVSVIWKDFVSCKKKLRRTVRERLYTNAKNAVSYLPVQLASQSTSVLLTDETQENSSCEEERCSTSELGQKRSLSPPQQGLLKKRQLQMSKIRQAPVVAGSNTSPAVTVSYYYLFELSNILNTMIFR